MSKPGIFGRCCEQWSKYHSEVIAEYELRIAQLEKELAILRASGK